MHINNFLVLDENEDDNLKEVVKILEKIREFFVKERDYFESRSTVDPDRMSIEGTLINMYYTLEQIMPYVDREREDYQGEE